MTEFFAELFAVDWEMLLGAAIASGVGLSAITQLLKAKWVKIPAQKYPRAVTAVLAVLTGLISTLAVGLELSSLSSFVVFTVIAFVTSGMSYDVVKRLVAEIKNEPADDSVTKLGTVEIDVVAKQNLTEAKKEASAEVANAIQIDKKSVEVIAQEVIDGMWASGETRKTMLETSGYNFDEVQAKVKEMLAKK